MHSGEYYSVYYSLDRNWHLPLLPDLSSLFWVLCLWQWILWICSGKIRMFKEEWSRSCWFKIKIEKRTKKCHSILFRDIEWHLLVNLKFHLHHSFQLNFIKRYIHIFIGSYLPVSNLLKIRSCFLWIIFSDFKLFENKLHFHWPVPSFLRFLKAHSDFQWIVPPFFWWIKYTIR